MSIETCGECGRQIRPGEPAFVHRQRILCNGCSRALHPPCTYCQEPLKKAPKAKCKCPACKRSVMVAKKDDGSAELMTEQRYQQWKAQRDRTPTQAQLEYAANIGLNTWDGITRDEVSRMLSAAEGLRYLAFNLWRMEHGVDPDKDACVRIVAQVMKDRRFWEAVADVYYIQAIDEDDPDEDVKLEARARLTPLVKAAGPRRGVLKWLFG